MIGDQIDAGLDVPTDGHLWYDRHQGFISSFLLYPAYHLDGITVEPEINPLMPGLRRADDGGLRRDLEQGRRQRPDRPRHDAPGRPVERRERGQPEARQVLQRDGPGQPRGLAHRRALPRQGSALRGPRRRLQRRVQGGGRGGRDDPAARRRRLHAARARGLPARPEDAQPRARGGRRLHDLPHLPPRQRRNGRRDAVRRASTSWWPTSSNVDAVEYAFAETNFPDARPRAVEALPERQGPRARRDQHQEARGGDRGRDPRGRAQGARVRRARAHPPDHGLRAVHDPAPDGQGQARGDGRGRADAARGDCG